MIVDILQRHFSGEQDGLEWLRGRQYINNEKLKVSFYVHRGVITLFIS